MSWFRNWLVDHKKAWYWFLLIYQYRLSMDISYLHSKSNLLPPNSMPSPVSYRDMKWSVCFHLSLPCVLRPNVWIFFTEFMKSHHSHCLTRRTQNEPVVNQPFTASLFYLDNGDMSRWLWSSHADFSFSVQDPYSPTITIFHQMSCQPYKTLGATNELKQ